jgi:hypothetical protein
VQYLVAESEGKFMSLSKKKEGKFMPMSTNPGGDGIGEQQESWWRWRWFRWK